MKTRLVLKFILMFIIPYICAASTFAGIFLSIIVHTHSWPRIALCSIIFAIFMYFVRIIVTFPLNNFKFCWNNKKENLEIKKTLISKLISLLIDFLMGSATIVLISEMLPHKVIVNHFVGICFASLFISLLIGNLIPPSLAVVQDSGSND